MPIKIEGIILHIVREKKRTIFRKVDYDEYKIALLYLSYTAP